MSGLNMVQYNKRVYRDYQGNGLVNFQVKVKQSDLFISAESDFSIEAEKILKRYREQLEDYIKADPIFKFTFNPISVRDNAPEIARVMAKVGKKCGVGPMAAVAGTIAEFVGSELLSLSYQVIVENGGDIFMKIGKKRRVSIFAGESPLNQHIALEIEPWQTPLGICTSSGTVGPSFSYGKADAVTVVSKSTPLADAAATAIGNIMRDEKDIPKGIKLAQSIDDLEGVVIIVREKIGIWGNLKIREI